MYYQNMIYPRDAHDVKRWEHTRLRRRIMEGEWRPDIEFHMNQHMDLSRKESWGPPSQALNLFKSVVTQVAVLYDEDPIVRNPMFTSETEAAFKNLSIWSRHQRLNQYVLGLRESLVRVEWFPGNHVSTPGIQSRIVTPDYVCIECHHSAPSVPLKIEEARCRMDPMTHEHKWYWDCWDISDPGNPQFHIYADYDTNGVRVDMTQQFTDITEYPYIDPQGNPYLPYIMYHAADTGHTWDPYEWIEMVYGSMDIALLWSFWIHIVKDASWQQKYGVDVTLQGLDTVHDDRATRQRITTDPSSILMFKSKEGNGSLGQFSQPMDPKSIGESIINYMGVLAENIGLVASDMERTQAQSGVSIKLKREPVRKLQKRYMPQFMKSDLELIRKVAMISNTFGGSSLPVDGYTLTYPALPLSDDELMEMVTMTEKLIAMGLKSKVDAIMEMNPGMTRDEAKARLQLIKQENV